MTKANLKIQDFKTSSHKDKILIGPLLGVENSADGELVYTVCFLLNNKSQTIPEITYKYENDDQEIEGVLDCEEVKLDVKVDSSSAFKQLYNLRTFKKIQGFRFYRAELKNLQSNSSRNISYSLNRGRDQLKTVHGKKSWSFITSAKNDFGRIAYASCNGWTTKKPPVDTYALWEDLLEQQDGIQEDAEPYNLLLMGGDQIYSDSFTYVTVADPDDYDPDHLDQKFLQQYFRSFSLNEYASEVLAKIPSLMMWDDHDICDGWGSYDDGFWTKFQCEIGMQEVFKAAIKYFSFFQLRGGHGFNKNLLDKKFKIDIDKKAGYLKHHFSQSLDWTSDTRIISMDLRSNRTPNQVCNRRNYKDIKSAIPTNPQKVFFMSSIPMGYLQYGRAINFLNGVLLDSWKSRDKEYSDDLMDHWHHKHHIGELESFIQGTKELLRMKKVVILSGDVHHAGISRIKFNHSSQSYLQLISSGIIHPAEQNLKKVLSLAGADDKVLNWLSSKLKLGDFNIELQDHMCWSNENADLNIDEING